MKIQIHIERLILDEPLLAGERPAQVRLAIERELARRLGAPGAIDTLQRIGVVDELSPLTLPPAQRARDGLGERVANALGRGLGIGDVMPATLSTGSGDDHV